MENSGVSVHDHMRPFKTVTNGYTYIVQLLVLVIFANWWPCLCTFSRWWQNLCTVIDCPRPEDFTDQPILKPLVSEKVLAFPGISVTADWPHSITERPHKKFLGGKFCHVTRHNRHSCSVLYGTMTVDNMLPINSFGFLFFPGHPSRSGRSLTATFFFIPTRNDNLTAMTEMSDYDRQPKTVKWNGHNTDANAFDQEQYRNGVIKVDSVP